MTYDLSLLVIAGAVTAILYVFARGLEAYRFEFAGMSSRRFMFLRCRSMMYFLSYPLHWPFHLLWGKLKKRYKRRFDKSRFGVAWKVYRKGLPKNNPPKTMTVKEFKEFVGAVAMSGTDYWFDDNVCVVFNGGTTPKIAVNMNSLKIVSSDVRRPTRGGQVRASYRNNRAVEEPPPWLDADTPR